MTQNRSYLSESLVELHVPDFQQAYDFYKLLGFELAWMEEDYMVLQKPRQAICFYGGSREVGEHSYFGQFPEQTKRGYGVEVILFVDDVTSLFQAIKDKVKVVRELVKRPWGVADFRIEDPFGFFVRVSDRYDAVNRMEKIRESAAIVSKKRFKL